MPASHPPPKLSVLLPVWNGERYLAAAIASVLAQTFADFELIVVDDGSSDGSLAIARGIRDPRVRCLANEKNLGVTRSLARAIGEARGVYLARMDADDLCAPDRFARQVAHLDTHPRVALVASRVRRIDAHGREIGTFDTPLDGDTLRRRLRLGNCIVHGSVMLRADAVRAVGGYDTAMERAEDYDLWLRLAERHEIAALPETLYLWRDHAGGVGRRHAAEQVDVAERVRLGARDRFAAALVAEVAAGRLTAEAAARRALASLWEEDAVRPAATGVLRWRGVCARRAPRLHAAWCALSSAGTRARLSRSLAACAAGRLDAAHARAAVIASLTEIDPS